jgi:hypothetical protein
MDLELDLSWISEQESILDHSQNIELKPLTSIPILAAYVDQGYVSFCKNIDVPLDISGGECSVLYSNKIIQIIQEYKKGLNDKSKWSWTHGALFHIDTDISHVYSFSAVSGNKFLKPIDFCSDLVIASSPDIFHFSSQIYLFFEKQTPPTYIKPILKSDSGINRGKSTKKVHLDLPVPILLPDSKTMQRSRRTRRSF